MRNSYSTILIVILFLCPAFTKSQTCNNWLKLPSQPSFVRIGDLDITGNKITVEASFIRTAPWNGTDLFQGDLVSKHEGSSDCNYLLRPGSAEITTSNGYFKTPTICSIELNKTYHAAMVYDGTTLKFYRNGFLMSQIAATGDLVQNDWQTQIGLYFHQITQENFIGYINEVRIWNVARTQTEIQTYMNQSLPTPSITPGLLAYYTFDNLLNKQGNAAWNGSLGGSASINEVNPNCNFIADSCVINVVPGFSAPDTVCINNPVNITNTSAGASSYYWNFCVADVNTPPTGTNLGNPGNYLSQPVFCDIEEDNGNYYGFIVNHVPGGITRLDFGNSLLNTPTAVFLGNISGVMNAGYGSEGIQIIKNNGNWYGVLVGGSPSSGSTPKLITIYFGANLNNPGPTAVSWGNIGNMLQPIDLHVFRENGKWYGLTVNAENNTITRFNFGNDFNNAPSGVNLGNIGDLSYPTGVFALNDNGNWYVFVCNGGASSITRLDFGNSLLNTPTGVNLGNPNNVLSTPRDITILKYCGQMIGFVNNATNGLVRLNFSSVTSAPTGTDLGNLGNLNFPHSLSKLFRAGNDIYSLITNVNNNTITRLKFTGCTNSSIPNSTAQNPPPITYGIPGTYNINLTVDDGLPTQAATCKQVVLVAPPVHSPIKTITVCGSKPVRIGSATPYSKYLWNTGVTTDSIDVTSSGLYWVETSRGGCSARDSFMIDIKGLCDSIKISGANKVCSEYDTVTYSIYKPSSCTQQYNLEVDNAFASIIFKDATSLKLLFRQNGRTTIKVAYDNDCKIVADSLEVAVQFSPDKINLGPDVISCGDTSFLLNAGEGFASYQWQNGTTTPDFFVNAPGMYTILVQNFCGDQFKDTIRLTSVFPAPFTVAPLTATVCEGDSLELKASGGTSYSWSPAANFNHSDAASVKALVDVSQSFSVSIVDSVCLRDTVVTIPVATFPVAEITISKSNDVNCGNDSAILIADGGLSYVWTPDLYITRSNNGRITVKPPKTTTYYVQSKNADGCWGKDSVTVSFSKTGDQKLYMPNAFTPNGDGLNDIFRPIFIGPAAHYDFKIYNRWGQLVFRTSTPGVGWDGRFNGVIQRSDVYVFYLTAEGDCNGKFEQKGTFVLIR